MFSPNQFEVIEDTETGRDLGYRLNQGKVTLVVGNRNCTRNQIERELGGAPLLLLKQVHGDAIHEQNSTWDSQTREADGHYSFQTNVGLGVVTADCLPALIWSSEAQVISAVHAGWRGVALQIIPKTIRRLIDSGVAARSIEIYVGPHIQRSHFEVHRDVSDKLASSHPQAQNFVLPHQDPKKVLFDLVGLVRVQLEELGVASANIYFDPRNTQTDLDWASFRRDGLGCGRNVTAIIQKSK